MFLSREKCKCGIKGYEQKSAPLIGQFKVTNPVADRSGDGAESGRSHRDSLLAVDKRLGRDTQ